MNFLRLDLKELSDVCCLRLWGSLFQKLGAEKGMVFCEVLNLKRGYDKLVADLVWWL